MTKDAYLTAADICDQLRLEWEQKYGGHTAFDAGYLSACTRMADELRKAAETKPVEEARKP